MKHNEPKYVTHKHHRVPALPKAPADLTEHKIQKLLRASELRYRRLFESARDGILILNAESGAIIDVNPFLVELLGFSRESFLDKKLWEIGIFKDIVANQDKFAELQSRGYVRYDDLPLITVDGRKVDVEFVSNVYLEDQEKVIQCNIRDITERKQANAALRANEERYRSLYNDSKNAIMMASPKTGFLDGNHATIALFGCRDEAELKSQSPASLSPEFQPDGQNSMTKAQEMMRLALEKGSHSFEWMHKRLDGTDFLADVLLSKVVSKGGECLQATVRDITEHKRAEEKLYRFAAIIENADEAIIATNLKGVVTSWNPGAQKLLGYPPEEILGRHITLLAVAGHENEMLDNIEKIRGGGPSLQYESERRAKDGTLVEIGAVISPIKDNAGNVVGVSRIYRDITERKRAVATLRQSEVRYRTLFEASADGILITDNETKMFRYANQAMCRMLGYTEEELRTLGVTDIHPKDALPSLAASLESQSRGEKTFASELPCLRKDKTIFYAEISATELPIDGRKCHMAMFRDITERKRMEVTLAESESKYRMIFDQAGDYILILKMLPDSPPIIQDMNESALRVFGYTREELIGKPISLLEAEKSPEVLIQERQQGIQKNGSLTFEVQHRRKDGSSFYAEARATEMDVKGTHLAISIERDITELKQAAAEREKLQAQLAQSQKMEIVDRLAGGVAHDFNNLLTAIKGYGEFVRDALKSEDPNRADVLEILSAADRAAVLTRQLLAFSRRQVLMPQVVDLNGIIGGMAEMLKRIIGEDMKLAIKLAPAPCLAMVDPGQTEQVIMNLAVNSRDAMPDGGTITLETEILTLDEAFFTTHPDLRRGPLACLIVRDTGCGMTDEAKKHLFEPFFTTKEKGKGTGLGLSTVFGIIKQSGGEILAESTPNSGTTFRIYFPQGETAPQDANKDKDKSVRGHETVLLVEDEDIVRRLGERALVENGYKVLTAANGQEALKVLEQHAKPVDLLVTDVVMPGMNGRELAQEIARRNMASRTLFLSGYMDDAIVPHGVLEPGLAFLYKPFSPTVLLHKMREVLDGPAAQAKT